MFDISTIDYRYAIWIIPIIFLFHELEEWNMVKWHRENLTGMTYLTNLEARLWLLFSSLIMFVLTAIAFLIPNNTISAILMYLLIDFTLINGLQHIAYVVSSRKYNPGSIFASILGIPADIYIIYIILEDGLLPYWAVIILLALVTIQFLTDMRAMNQNRRPALLSIAGDIARKLGHWMTD